MAEISPKRHREESQEGSISSELESSSSCSKRQKPYNNILNLLDEEEDLSDEPNHELSRDLSAIFTTFQQELSSSTSCDSTTTFDFESLPSTEEVEAAELPTSADEDESVKSVMRHLLEASDDELGIPNPGDENGVENFNAAGNLPLEISDDHGLWELEDVTANYYTVLQSELFMQ